MVDAKIIKVNESFVEVEADLDIIRTINEHFVFYAPNYKWNPKYRAGIWDGKIRIFRMNQRKLYIGLLNRLVNFLIKMNISFTLDKRLKRKKTSFSLDQIKKFIKKKLKVDFLESRDYQLWAVQEAVAKNKSIIVSPTASGKSFIFYVYANILWYLNRKAKILFIVPNIGLVEQMYFDFLDYARNLPGYEKYLHRIYSGQSKQTNKPITISTWQSLQDMPKKFFDKYDIVMVDEVHTGTDDGKTITRIMEYCSSSKYRLGMTGTLDCSFTHEMVLIGLFGPIKQFVTTKELIDQGYLTPIKIKTFKLNYKMSDRKLVSGNKMTYQEEMKFIRTHRNRMRVLANFLGTFHHGNILGLFRSVAFGKRLVEEIKMKYPKRKVRLVYGGTPVEDRENVRKLAEAKNNIIIVASYGVFSTGVNIKNLPNIALLETMKSKIKILQSIGRGLRKHSSKVRTLIFDFVDDLSYKRRYNYVMKHYRERVNIYESECFKIKEYEIKI